MRTFGKILRYQEVTYQCKIWLCNVVRFMNVDLLKWVCCDIELISQDRVKRREASRNRVGAVPRIHGRQERRNALPCGEIGK